MPTATAVGSGTSGTCWQTSVTAMGRCPDGTTTDQLSDAREGNQRVPQPDDLMPYTQHGDPGGVLLYLNSTKAAVQFIEGWPHGRARPAWMAQLEGDDSR
jgi:hypothetical protein